MANLSNINGKFVVEQTTGYVGVGTTDPNFLIEAAAVNSEIALNSTSASIYRLRSTSSDSFIITKNGVGDRLVIDGSGNSTFTGNVGIGAAASDGNLHVRKTGVNTGITNVLMNANFADGSNGTGLSIGYRTDETTAVIAARTATGNIAFYSYDGGWSESMRIKNNGDVGIGTDDPVQPLHVNGQVLFRTTTADGGKNRFQLIPGGSSDAANLYLYYGNTGDGTLSVRINAQGDSYFNGGNVGIGSTNPSSKLTVEGAPANGTYLSYLYNSATHSSANGLNVQTSSNNILTYGLRVNTAGDSNALAVMGNGKVGIGTASPGYKLDVESDTDSLAGAYIQAGKSSQGEIQNTGLIIGSRTDTATGDYIGVSFSGNATVPARGRAAIGAVSVNGASGMDLVFMTRNAGDGSQLGTGDEKMRIDTSGNVAISGNGIQIDRPNVAGGKPYIFWKSGGTTQASIYGASSGAGLRIFLSGGTAAFDNSISFTGIVQQNAQSVVLSNSAYSNAAAVQAYATNTANVYPGYGFHKASNLGGFLYATSRTELRYRGDGGTDKVLLMADSDYEEGTWTPTGFKIWWLQQPA